MRMGSSRCCCTPQATALPLYYFGGGGSGSAAAIREDSFEGPTPVPNFDVPTTINPLTGRQEASVLAYNQTRHQPPTLAFFGSDSGSLGRGLNCFEVLHRINSGRNRKYTVGFRNTTTRYQHFNWGLVGTDWRGESPVNSWYRSWWDTTNDSNYHTGTPLTSLGDPEPIMESVTFFDIRFPVTPFLVVQSKADIWSGRINSCSINASGNKIAFCGDECYGDGGLGNVGIISLDTNGDPTGMSRVSVGPRPNAAWTYSPPFTPPGTWTTLIRGGVNAFRLSAWQIEAIGDEGWIVSYPCRARPAYTAATRGRAMTRLDASGSPTNHLLYSDLTFTDGALGVMKLPAALDWDNPALADSLSQWASSQVLIKNFAVSLDNQKLFLLSPVSTAAGVYYWAAYTLSNSLSVLSAKVLTEYGSHNSSIINNYPAACSIIPHPDYPEGIAMTLLVRTTSNLGAGTGNMEGRRLDTLAPLWYAKPAGTASDGTPSGALGDVSIDEANWPMHNAMGTRQVSYSSVQLTALTPYLQWIMTVGHQRHQ